MSRIVLVSVLFVALAALASCGKQRPPGAGSPSESSRASHSAGPPPGSIKLARVDAAAGIDFRLGHGGKSPLNILETAGGGCAFLDYDGDGWPDILLVGPHNIGLYRNRGNGTFANVTAKSGLNPRPYWMGCAVGDYDGDGRPDIFLTGYRCFALLHNEGGKFRDVTRESGITGLDWSLSAAFADFNADGRLDLFVSQYVAFDSSKPQLCAVGDIQSACGPEVYQPLSGRMYLNVDGRRFKPIAWKDSGKTWGALASDLLDTGRPALYLANDMVPADLWTLEGGKWTNRGPATGTAFDAQGNIQGGMGVDSADYDNDGRLDLLVTTYFAQQNALYHNDGHGAFTVTSSTSGLGPPTMPYVAFGTSFVDLDNDGWPDVVIANGHVRDNMHSLDASQQYAQPAQAFRNMGGRFTDVTRASGMESVGPLVGRGLAVGDYNRDGRPDILICNLEGQAALLQNRSSAGHWIDVRLRGPGGNRDGIGARLRVTAGTRTQVLEIRTCGSVMSAREPVAHVGLGDHAGPVTVDVAWPDRKKQTVHVSQVDRQVTVERK
jgi:hypothetical protein